ncbi:OpgC family protein [Methylobrevis albus]|uniref:OpgC domain-containing protein n=1 Tax=Methylobrevis albus TaxID=2793297 RepID=A0A931MYY0_9HYPH|nr:OpgC domain-containing protein [Methylobrevis albus]
MPVLTRTPSEPAAATRAPAPPAKRPRDPRLDVFRGIGMAIILIAHVPGNPWILWIPARFGFSDATEIFVCLSGMASAIAFGRVFDREGFALGTARVAQRVWQVYWAHVCLFLTVAAIMVVAGTAPNGLPYVNGLNLHPFFNDPMPQLVGLLTLTYVPNYFDILPMYLVILALMPLVLAAERLHRAAAFALVGGLWLTAQTGALDLPAEPWSERPWFFNPFGWQLIFFCGFFLMRGRLPAPPWRPAYAALAALVLLATIPFAWHVALRGVPAFAEVAEALRPLTSKSSFGILRLVHFGALAYLAYHLAGEGGRRLKGPLVRLVAVVGQQSLAVFLASMVIAQMLGILMDHTGRGPLSVAAANLLGLAGLVAVAFTVRWFKQAPWKAAG